MLQPYLHPGNSRLRNRFPRVAPFLLGAFFLVQSVAAQAINLPPAGTRLKAGADYATLVLGDPWDMGNVEDVAQFPLGTRNFLPGAGFTNGTWAGTTGVDASLMLLYQGMPSNEALYIGRLGMNFPINAGFFKKLTVKFYSSVANEVFGAHWSPHPDSPTSDWGVKFLSPNTQVGWQVRSGMLTPQTAGGSWSGLIRGFWIDPNEMNTTGMQFAVDWVRLTGGVDDVSTPVSWQGGTSATVVEAVDAGGTIVNQIGTGASGSVTWYYDGLPPGAYRIRMRDANSGAVTATRDITVNDPPIIHVTSPDETGGPDWATDVKANTWDMAGPNDVLTTRQVHSTSYTVDGGRTVFQGTSDASTSWAGDPQVVLVDGGLPGVDAARYHRFSFRMYVDHANPADWVTTRVMWGKDPVNSSLMSSTQDIMVWNREYRTFTVDLATLTEPSGIEPGGSAGTWSGLIRQLRFDPLEYPEATVFRIDEVKLAADAETSPLGTYEIRWTASDRDNAPTVSLYYDIDQDPSGGFQPIATGLAASAGSYIWNATGVPPGRYFIRAVIDDGLNPQVRYSTGPVVVTEAVAAAAPALPGDFTGDGKADFAVFRPSEGRWRVDGVTTDIFLGMTGDVPVPGNYNDWNGPGRIERAVWRPSNGRWYWEGGSADGVLFGVAGDIPTPADYNADGVTDVAVFRPSTGTWFVRNWAIQAWGAPGDIPLAGDYDGDGRADFAVYRPSIGMWFILRTSNGQTMSFQWGAPGDIPVPADYDGNGTMDPAVFRPSTGWWYVRNSYMGQFGTEGDWPVPLDVDGDGASEFVVFRPAEAKWFVLDPATGARTEKVYGAVGDMLPLQWAYRAGAVQGDFDGDGRADPAVYRPSAGYWYGALSSTNRTTYLSVYFGQAGDRPVAGDYDGDGRMEPAVYRPSTGTWWVRRSTNGAVTGVQWGTSTDIPVPGDYDGDNRTDYAVFRPSNGTWYVLGSSVGPMLRAHGTAGDIPVPADYDGDGRADVAVFRPSNNTWYILSSSTAPRQVGWGIGGDIPVPADYDGDGRADVAVYRPSNGYWYLNGSATGFSLAQWGTSGDTPIPADYTGDGRADPTIFREWTGYWWVKGAYAVELGVTGDLPVSNTVTQVAAVLADPTRLEWNPNVEPDLAGYLVLIGTAPGSYTKTVDVGNQTAYSLSGLAAGSAYYLAVKAYNAAGLVSAPSAEVVLDRR